MNIYTDLEVLLDIQIPQCVKTILYHSGFDTELSIENLDESLLLQSEKDVNNAANKTFKTIFNGIQCCFSETYRKDIHKQQFKFIESHRELILNLPEKILLKKSLQGTETTLCLEQLKDISKQFKENPALPNMIGELLETAIANYKKTPNLNRYSNVVKDFATYIYLLCGRLSYEVLSCNLSMPAATTVLKVIHSQDKITEGALRCTELKAYLEKIGASNAVWLSEDGTGIVKRVVYDVSSNQLVGLNLPLDENTGMPISYTFVARNLQDIEKHMKKPLSSLVYIVMAQPAMPNCRPFVLQIFGTNNKFTRLDVLHRWTHIKNELMKVGIQVLGIATDGDSRPLGAMKANMDLKLKPIGGNNIFFSKDGTVYFQDTTHIGTKLRNRLLKASILLAFGTKPISLTHLKELLKLAPKDVHGLVRSDISPDDRQNFRSLQKLMEYRVEEALKKYVIDSEATIVYLQICRNVTSSFLDEKLTPDERVYRIWYSVFLLRIWRAFLSKSKMYSVKENFISGNAFDCIELNALGLVQLVITLREAGKSDMFLPILFDSQVCESIFRQLRSMGTINWTKINFTLMELLHMVSRVELQNDIMYKLANIVKFPRENLRGTSTGMQHHQLLSNQEIESIIQRACIEAVQCASKFGMTCEKSDLHECRLKIREVENIQQNTRQDTEEENFSDSESENSLIHREKINLRDYSSEDIAVGENSKYIEICEADGTIKLVLKSSIVWMLSENPKKLSNDRLKRVQTSSVKQVSKRQKTNQPECFSAGTSSSAPHNEIPIEIKIGDWCFFKSDSDTNRNFPKDVITNLFFGPVLAFKYIEGRTEKSKQYLHDSACVEDDVEVLSSWYLLRVDGILVSLATESIFFINIKNYIAKTMPPKLIENNRSVDISYLPDQIKDKFTLSNN